MARTIVSVSQSYQYSTLFGTGASMCGEQYSNKERNKSYYVPYISLNIRAVVRSEGIPALNLARAASPIQQGEYRSREQGIPCYESMESIHTSPRTPFVLEGRGFASRSFGTMAGIAYSFAFVC